MVVEVDKAQIKRKIQQHDQYQVCGNYILKFMEWKRLFDRLTDRNTDRNNR